MHYLINTGKLDEMTAATEVSLNLHKNMCPRKNASFQDADIIVFDAVCTVGVK